MLPAPAPAVVTQLSHGWIQSGEMKSHHKRIPAEGSVPEQGWELRPATAADQSGIIQLIETVYGEYGERMCLEGADSDLLQIPRYYHERDGEFWVLAGANGAIAGTHAAFTVDAENGICGFRRLYLEKQLRGTSWGRQLMQVAIDFARSRDFGRIEFWSDVRFTRAHHFFRKFGFVPDGCERTMYDGHEPYSEMFFYLDLS